MKKSIYLLFAFFLIIQIGKAQDTTLWVSIDVTPVSGPSVCDGAITASPYGGVPPYLYVWTPTAYTQTITDLCPGVYTVVVTDSEGTSVTVTAEVTEFVSDIYGCMDLMALNYNPLATIDDGSCVYDSLPGDSTYYFGCTDPGAFNYNPYATVNDGSCYYDSTGATTIWGCMDPMALNYNPLANASNSYCIYYYSEYVLDTCISDMDSAYIIHYELIDSTTLIVTWGIVTPTGTEMFTFTYEVEIDGVYYIMLTINCDEAKASQDIFLGIIDVDYSSITGIDSEKNSLQYNVYPNPSDGTLFVDLSGTDESISMQLINTTGQVCWASSENSGRTVQISVGNMPKGVYFLKLTSSSQIETSKIILR